MFQYHCLNPIAGVGLANFNENYQQSESLEGADAVLVRSAAMHGMELPKSLFRDSNLRADRNGGKRVGNGKQTRQIYPYRKIRCALHPV